MAIPRPLSHPRATQDSNLRPDWRFKLYSLVIELPPSSFLALFILIFAYSLSQPPPSGPRFYTRPHTRPPPQSTFTSAPSLQALLADVADALDAHNVTYWLQPGLGLLPSTSPSHDGKLTPWLHGVDLAANHSHQMSILLAQTSLQPHGILAVESYFGLRLYHASARLDQRYDFGTPFVDIVYTRQHHAGHTLSYCCDCAPVVVNACTKKTCACLVCATPAHHVFQLVQVRIEDVRRALPGPADLELLMLPRGMAAVHDSVFDL